jgi:dTDP-glucose 4,6-dehydratase
MISERLGVRFEDQVEVVGERLGKDAAYLLDCTLAKERLQWKPRISLREGLDRTTGWLKDNLESLLRQPQDYIHKP